MDIRPNRRRYVSNRSGVVYVGNQGGHRAGYWGRGAVESRLRDFGKLASNCGQVNLDSKKISFKAKFPEESVSWLHLSRKSHLCIGNVSFNVANNPGGDRVLRNLGLQSDMGSIRTAV